MYPWFSFYITSSSSGLDCSIILHCIACVFMLKTEFHMCLIIELYGLQTENINFYYLVYSSLSINSFEDSFPTHDIHYQSYNTY